MNKSFPPRLLCWTQLTKDASSLVLKILDTRLEHVNFSLLQLFLRFCYLLLLLELGFVKSLQFLLEFLIAFLSC